MQSMSFPQNVQRGHIINHLIIMLPQIKLPLSWLEFRNLYTDLVHDNPGIVDAEKFYYLKTNLDDGIRRLIAKIDVMADNYRIAYMCML